jgi:membrane protease YdiL (CAAX protease family)
LQYSHTTGECSKDYSATISTMTKKTIVGYNKLISKNFNYPSTIDEPFTIKFGLFMAFLVSFLLPLVIFSPLIVTKMLDIKLIEWIGVTEDKFGIYIFFSQAVGLLVCLMIIANKLNKHRISWSGVGLKSFKVFQAMRYIAGYYLILLGLLFALAVVATSLGVQVPSTPNNESGGTGMLRVMGSFWLTLLLTVIVAPIVEELVFRGVLFPAIRKRYGLFVGIVASSLIFTLVHINPIQMISVLPLGIYLAIMYQRTGSIYPGMILHATWNLVVLLIAQASI